MKQELMQISGIGEATADKILEVIEAHSESENSNVQAAIEHLEAGLPEQALELLKQGEE